MNYLMGTLMPFLGALACQLVGIALIPRTRGFSVPLVSVACAAAFVVSLWMIARLANGGASLSILIPLINAAIPLGAVIMGVLLYGEAASPLKFATLVLACGLIGFASRMH